MWDESRISYFFQLHPFVRGEEKQLHPLNWFWNECLKKKSSRQLIKLLWAMAINHCLNHPWLKNKLFVKVEGAPTSGFVCRGGKSNFENSLRPFPIKYYGPVWHSSTSPFKLVFFCKIASWAAFLLKLGCFETSVWQNSFIWWNNK